MPNPTQKRILVYPYDRRFCPLVAYRDILGKTTFFNTLISPNGWGLTGKDAGYADSRRNLGIIVNNDDNINEDIKNNDIFLAASGDWNAGIREKALKYMHLAIDLKKDIWCAIKLSGDELLLMRDKCSAAKVNFRYFMPKLSAAVSKTIFEKPQKLYKPDAAVIFVTEVVDDTNGYDVLLSLYQSFKNAGHNVSAIGNRTDCELMGFHSMPEFITDAQSNAKQVIDYFNNYIKYILTTERSDVIIINIPDCLTKYDDILTCGYGVIPYLISQAVQPDYVIACIPCGEVDGAKLLNLSESCKYRFGFEIDFFHMSNVHVDYNASISKLGLSYDYLDFCMVEETIMECSSDNEITICNILDGNGDFAFRHILSLIES